MGDETGGIDYARLLLRPSSIEYSLGGQWFSQLFPLMSLNQLLERLETVPYPEGSAEGQPEPLGLSLTVPDSVLTLEAPHVARWDPTGRAIGRAVEPGLWHHKWECPPPPGRMQDRPAYQLVQSTG